MKLKTLSVAVAVAAASTQVNALPKESLTSIDNTLSLYIAGASAADRQVTSYINLMCKDEPHVYKNDKGNTAGVDKSVAYVCTLDSAQVDGINADEPVIFYKNSGGSSRGVAPVANQTVVDQVDLNNCATTTGQTTDCGGVASVKNPMVGISDVEPELFGRVENGAKTFDASKLVVSPMNAATFGVVATPELRNALQAAQGLTVGSEEASQMPSLSSATIANIFTKSGPITSWDQLKGQDGQGIVTAYNTANGTAFKDGVALCIRKPGSGTQAQFNVFYMKNACLYRGAAGTYDLSKRIVEDNTNGLNNYTVPGGFFGENAAPWIFGNNGSDDMGRCLTQMAAQNRMALGFQALEKVGEDEAPLNRFKFLAIDGVVPTLENVAAGLYHNWASATIQWNSDVVQPNTKVFALASKLRDMTQNYSDVAAANAGLRAPNANSPQFTVNGTPANVGSLAFIEAANNKTAPAGVSAIPFNVSYPVASFDKGLNGGTNCDISTFKSGADVNVSVK